MSYFDVIGCPYRRAENGGGRRAYSLPSLPVFLPVARFLGLIG